MSEPTATSRLPEKEFPVSRGSKIAVWPNSNGRSVTVSPPRFKDQQGNWRDGGFFLSDVALLIFALQQALAYCYGTPQPSMDNDPVK